MAALQEQFAEVKRKHQQNYRQWRKDFTECLLGMEAAHLKPPRMKNEYIYFQGTFTIQFTTDEYNIWVIHDGLQFA